jgi:hypothetical protein
MHFSRQARSHTIAHLDGVDLELRAPRVKIVVRSEWQQWRVVISWLTDRRQWKVAYSWKVWSREQGAELAEYLAECFASWDPGRKGPSPIPEWLKQCAKAGMPVSMERLKERSAK